MKLCEYGCGNEGKYKLKNGKWCCGPTHNSCPITKEKIRNKIKEIQISKVYCKWCNKEYNKFNISQHEHGCTLNINRIKKCPNCDNIILNNENIFCSKSCFASYNNKKRKKEKFCLNCNIFIEKQSKFCSNRCQQDFKYKELVKKWLNGEISGTVKSGCAKFIKRYLKEVYGDKCSICGWSEKNPITETVTVETDHIDGNAYNNDPKNIRLICPNCHSLTKNYKALNKISARNYRKARIP